MPIPGNDSSNSQPSRRASIFRSNGPGMADFRKKMRKVEPTYKLKPDERPDLASIRLVMAETLQSK